MNVRAMLRSTIVILGGLFLFGQAAPALAVVVDQDSSSYIIESDFRVAPDSMSGAFVYSYPITLPPGRNGLQPSLGINYSSGNTDASSIVGYGWSLGIPVIERINRYGTDDLYANHDFTSSLSGELEDVSLSDGTHGTYGAKVDDGSLLVYTFDTNEVWTVTDKLGNEYTFGSAANARLSDPSTSSHVFRWYLTKIEDANGNTVTYTYSKNGSQVYPDGINYTGNGTASGIFDVDFTLESRSDVTTSFATGFEVETAYRVSDILVKVDGDTVRSYALDYVVGDNGVRSLLDDITETATTEDGLGSIIRTPTEFAYETAERTWTQITSFSTPELIAGSGSGSLGIYIFDVNGDALPDFVKSRDTSTTPSQAVYINNGNNTWTQDTGYSIPVTFSTSQGKDRGVRVFDMNGDGFQDLVYAYSSNMSNTAVYINNANGTGWTQNSAITVPLPLGGSADQGVRIVDVDGDGMQDLVKARENSLGSYDQSVYINNGNGTGWTQDTGYAVPIAFTSFGGTDLGVRSFDVNGDGLVDLVQGRTDTSGTWHTGVYINDGDGTGWTLDAGFTVPLYFVGSAGKDRGVRIMDLNGDGLADLLRSQTLSTGADDAEFWINDGDGTGWTQDAIMAAPLPFTGSTGADYGVREYDIDGDMMDDILRSRDIGGTRHDNLYLADGGRADILTGISHTAGGSTAVTYTTSTLADAGPWFSLQVVDTVTTNDGLGNTATTTYDYADGGYYYASEYERKFAGFGVVTTTDALGNVTKKFYHQGDTTDATHGEETDDASKIGRVYREEYYDDASHLYRAVIHSVANTDLGNDRDFVYETQTLELLYDADSDHRDKATTYTYNTTTGNLTQQVELGEVTGEDDGDITDIGTDGVTTAYTYAQWPSSAVSGYVSEEAVTDYSSTTLKKTRRFYDNQAYGDVTVGNMTGEAFWESGSTYRTTVYEYDAYGFLIEKTDPRNNATAYTPDAYELYPATVTDALLNETTYTYDYSSGKVTQTTDANSAVTTTEYDALDRPIEEQRPDPRYSNTLKVTKAWSYTDTSVPSLIHETIYADDTIARETYVYSDGFGRPVQQRVEAQGTSAYNVTDTIYDDLGRVASTSLPYAATGSSYSSPTTNAALYATLTYDALGRVTATTDAVGTSTKSYEAWEVSEVDAESIAKEYTYDAFGRLVSVDEHPTASTTETTEYNWNAIGQLIGMTDADGNVRAFTYDGRGLRLTAEDLHASTDTTFGTWTFTYDAAGNMATSVSPNGVTTTYAYDVLNRVTSENASSTTATDITYAYDTCTNGVGRLCSVTVDGGATTAYAYDKLGRVSTETKAINSTSYATAFVYDRTGAIESITYPDTSELAYGLDNAGRVDELIFTDIITAGSGTPVSSVTYAPNGKIATIAYGDGSTTTFTYDANSLYRLTNVTTTVGSTVLQDFDYTYDDVGNITNLTDASSLYAGMSISYTYDDLYRLTNATSTSTDTALAYNNSWTYGATGNILTSPLGTYTYGGTGTGNYANPHAVTAIGSQSFTYDNNGNQTNDGTWTNTWNYRNELTQSAKTGTTVTYQYDHEGNRVYQSNGTTSTIYPNSNYSVEGTVHVREIPFAVLGSVATFRYDSSDSSVDKVYHHKDHLGGNHVDTDDTGAVVETMLYTPFGDILLDSQSGTYENRRKFTGKEKDEDTGYYYYGARYYQSGNGRFMSEDPVFLEIGVQETKKLAQMLQDPQLLNSYTYSRNNPIIFVDLDGRWPSLASLASRVDAVYNAITFGAGHRASEMGRNGLTVGGVAQVAGGIAGGTIITSAAAVTTGATTGMIANVAPIAAATTMPRATTGITVGTSFGKLGTVITNQSGKITSFLRPEAINPYHGLDQAITRGVTTNTMLQVVRSPLVTLQQAGGNTMYLTKQAAVILNKAGQVVTTYGSSQFKEPVINILKSVNK